MVNPQSSNILALDIGDKRIGVARASLVARLPEPLTTLANDEHLTAHLTKLIQQYQVGTVIIGLPRGLQGQTTSQSTKTRKMAEKLSQLPVKLVWQDETLTSVQAEQELRDRSVRYNKEMVDALAATLILEDFLRTHPPT